MEYVCRSSRAGIRPGDPGARLARSHPGIAADRHAGGANHLIGGDIEIHQERAELPVELSGRIERMLFPAVAIVDHHLGVPLGEVEAPALTPLAARRTVDGRASQSISTDMDSPDNNGRGRSKRTTVLSGAKGYTGRTGSPMIRTSRT